MAIFWQISPKDRTHQRNFAQHYPVFVSLTKSPIIAKYPYLHQNTTQAVRPKPS